MATHTQVPECSASTVVDIPAIIVTEPSPLLLNKLVSAAGKIETAPGAFNEMPIPAGNESVPCEPDEGDNEQTASLPESEISTSAELQSTEECNDCLVSVPDAQESMEDAAAASSSGTDQDDFRTEPCARCCACTMCIVGGYERAWNALHCVYSIPVWLLLLALPFSAGIMGSLYMYSCPAAHAMTILIFIIGLSLMAVITLRICIIVHKITNGEESWRNAMQTLVLVATFVTTIFFATESVAFWKMDPTDHPGTLQYCDPHFLEFSFWWNCIMSVVIVPLVIFPA